MVDNKTTLDCSAAELRSFGLIFALFQLLLFGLLFPLIFNVAWSIWPLVVAAMIAGLALKKPLYLKMPHFYWLKFGSVMGRINSFIILVILFFLIILPFGIFFRICRADMLNKKIDKSLKSYRVTSEAKERKHFERPY